MEKRRSGTREEEEAVGMGKKIRRRSGEMSSSGRGGREKAQQQVREIQSSSKAMERGSSSSRRSRGRRSRARQGRAGWREALDVVGAVAAARWCWRW